jgi:hypothetical protein
LELIRREKIRVADEQVKQTTIIHHGFAGRRQAVPRSHALLGQDTLSCMIHLTF